MSHMSNDNIRQRVFLLSYVALGQGVQGWIWQTQKGTKENSKSKGLRTKQEQGPLWNSNPVCVIFRKWKLCSREENKNWETKTGLWTMQRVWVLLARISLTISKSTWTRKPTKCKTLFSKTYMAFRAKLHLPTDYWMSSRRSEWKTESCCIPLCCSWSFRSSLYFTTCSSEMKPYSLWTKYIKITILLIY